MTPEPDSVEVEATPVTAVERRRVSVNVGRPRELASARRFVATQRERTLLRLWRGAPEAISYLVDVVAGRRDFDAGRYKAATQILSRCVPTLTAQAIQSDTVSTVMTVEGDGTMAAARALLQEVLASEQAG